MIKSISTELAPIEAPEPHEIKAALLKVLSSQIEDQGNLWLPPDHKIEVEDIMKELEKRGSIPVATVATAVAKEAPQVEKAEAQEPQNGEPVIEELKEESVGQEDDLSGLRPIVRGGDEDSEEESGQEEGELASYRKQRLAEKTKEVSERREPARKHSSERRHSESYRPRYLFS